MLPSDSLFSLHNLLAGLPEPIAIDAKHVNVVITGMAPLASAEKNHLAFFANAKYLAELRSTRAAAVLIKADHADSVPAGVIALVVTDPYAAFARVSQILNKGLARPAQIGRRHASAVIDPLAIIDPTVDVGPMVVIEAGASIGARTVLSPGAVIGRNVQIGDDCWIGPRVVVYYDSQIGSACILHAGAVIGADGFGFAPEKGQWLKVEQLGRVVIGDQVEIGANTTIDRGALGDTEIGLGCKLDNQIQIAHNVRIGEHCAIAACVGIAGSAIIGKRCMLGGSAGILGHLEICDDVTISSMSLVISSIEKPGFYSGIYPLQSNRDWERSAAVVRNLPEMRQRLRKVEQLIEQQIADMTPPAQLKT